MHSWKLKGVLRDSRGVMGIRELSDPGIQVVEADLRAGGEPGGGGMRENKKVRILFNINCYQKPGGGKEIL